MSDIDQLMPDIKSVAKTIAWKWPSITTPEDMTNDIVVKLLQEPGSLRKILNMSVGQRRSSLMRIGHQIASAERDDFDLFSGKYIYSVDEVKKMLSAGALKDDDNRFRVSGVDVVEAMIHLQRRNPRYATLIIDRYVDNVHSSDLNDQKALRRAVQSLTKLMNRNSASKQYDYSNGGRDRPSVNNQSALSIADYHYEGYSDTDGT